MKILISLPVGLCPKEEEGSDQGESPYLKAEAKCVTLMRACTRALAEIIARLIFILIFSACVNQSFMYLFCYVYYRWLDSGDLPNEVNIKAHLDLLKSSLVFRRLSWSYPAPQEALTSPNFAEDHLFCGVEKNYNPDDCCLSLSMPNFPMESADSLGIIEVLVCRAANLESFQMEGSIAASSSQANPSFPACWSTARNWSMLHQFRGIHCASTIVVWFPWKCSFQSPYSN